MAASIISGGAPKNFIPSEPSFALFRTHSLASSGDFTLELKVEKEKILGAIISFFLLLFFNSNFRAFEREPPGSLIEVIPCAIHSLNTYSGLAPCDLPPI